MPQLYGWSLQFVRWWRSPTTAKERWIEALSSAFALFWIVGLGRLFAGAAPTPLDELALWAFAGMLLGAFLGATFPKLMHCVLRPFSCFGIGSDS